MQKTSAHIVNVFYKDIITISGIRNKFWQDIRWTLWSGIKIFCFILKKQHESQVCLLLLFYTVVESENWLVGVNSGMYIRQRNIFERISIHVIKKINFLYWKGYAKTVLRNPFFGFTILPWLILSHWSKLLGWIKKSWMYTRL